MTRESTHDRKRTAWLVLAAGILILSFSSIITKKSNAPVSIYLFYRMFFSILFMLPIYIRHRGRKTTSGFSDKTWLRILLIPLFAGFVKGIDYYFAGSSLHLTTVAHSTILNNLSPLWCVLLSYFVFGKKLRIRHLIGAVIAFFGLTIVFRTQDAIKIGRGELYAIIASVFYGAYFVITQKGREYLDNIEYYFWLITSTGFFMLILNLVKGVDFIHYPKEEWVLFLISALLCQVVGHLAITYSLGTLTANKVTVAMLLQPIITTVLAGIIIKEYLGLMQWIGILVVLFGIYIVNQDKEGEG